jgi:NHLM bacteriocin system ABC transporter peptidase/ATP-binding protein
VAFVVLAGLALVIPGLAIAAFTRVFVDEVLIAGNPDWLIALVVGLLVVGGLWGGVTWLQEYFLLRFENRLAIASSSRFLWHLLRLPVDYFTQRYSGEVVGRLSTTLHVAQLLSGELATTAVSLIMIVFYAAVMFMFDVRLTVIGIVMASLNFAVLQFISRRRIDGSRRLLMERARVTQTAMSGLQMIETLKSLGAENDFFARWAGNEAKALNAEQDLGVLSQRMSIVLPLLNTLNAAAILLIGGIEVMNGNMTVGTLVAFQSLMLSFTQPIDRLVVLGSTLQELHGEMDLLDDVLRAELDPVAAPEDEEADSLPPGPAKLAGHIEIRGLTFGYNPNEPPLLENFSLELHPGDRVAIVGGSGSGKSMVAKLVAGLYAPWEGEILFDGKPREELPRTFLANSLALVSQEISLFEGTVAENISLWDSTIAEDRIVRAAIDADIHDDVAARKGGYASPVSEGGQNFSGGQRQRLEIARALAQEPTMMILDEATSALDTAAERKVDDSLRRRDCTCLIVAHRLSTIRDCDEILVLEQGGSSSGGATKS